MPGKVLHALGWVRLRPGWLTVLGVASIVVAGFQVSSVVGYTLAGIGLAVTDILIFGSGNANTGRRSPE